MTISINTMNDMLGRPVSGMGGYDSPHGPWPAHIDTFHDLGGGYLKSRVGLDGSLLSCDYLQGSMRPWERLRDSIAERYR